MREAVRRLVAFTAGVIVEGHQPDGIFDFATGSRFPVTGDIDGDSVDIADETEGVRLTGTLPDLQTGDGQSLTLRIEDDAFGGTDDLSGAAFHGRVSGRNIDLADTETGDSYTFCL